VGDPRAVVAGGRAIESAPQHVALARALEIQGLKPVLDLELNLVSAADKPFDLLGTIARLVDD
jgi:hypothetical protein